MSRRSPTRKVPETLLEVAVEKLVPGGEGLARHQGKVIFIPGALPGESLRVRLTESKRDYARAEIVGILSPSPDRVEPPCPLAGRCGGCDWQHLAYPVQLREKVALAADALRRIGNLSWPGLEIEAGEPWRYRSRARLHAAPGGKLGFQARGSRNTVPVDTCPVADPALDALIRAGAANAPGGGAAGSGAAAGRGAPPQYLAFGHSGSAAIAPAAQPAGDQGAAPAGRYEAEASDAVPSPGAERELRVEVLGKPLVFDLRCFFQSNVPMLEKLIPYALEGLSGSRAMDLYCGVGVFGAFLADRFRSVTAVEENPVSLAYARRNIPGPEHRFLEGRLEDLALQGRLGGPGEGPEAVVVDPPRPGLDQAVRDWLAEHRPRRLVYVSCNPVTLARDLKTLLAAGFRLDGLRLFDFYPQTAHVEAVARLSA